MADRLKQRDEGVPLTKAQYQIWLGADTPGREGLYPLSALLRLGGDADLERMEQAAEALIREAEVLRLRVGHGPDGPIQMVDGDRGGYSKREFQTAADLEGYFDVRAKEPIPLDGPLAELELLSAPEERALLLRVHHIAADGAGLNLLLERFCGLYAGDDMPPLPSFLAYAASHPVDPAERDEADRDFWRAYLSGAELDEKPRPVEPGPAMDCELLEVPLGRTLTARVRGLAEKMGQSPYSVYLSAFTLYLSRVCGAAEATIFVPRLGRDSDEARRTPGMFTMAVPVRIPVIEEESFASLCARSRAQSRLAAEHKDYGLSEILSDQAANGALSQFTLSYLDLALDTHGLSARVRFHFANAMTNLLSVYLMDWGEAGLELKCEARRGWWQEEELVRLTDSLRYILEQVTLDPDLPCAAVELVPEQEKTRLGALLRGPEPEAPPADTIHGLFCRQAEQMPDAPAFFCEDRNYSYRELDEASDTVCQNLLALGLERGDIVAFQLPRTSLVPAIMLGILKAGGAFLPMDCTWPEERRAFLLADSGARFVISDGCATPGNCPGVTPQSLLRPCGVIADAPKTAGADLAYVIYTSGTTGTPKGVLLEHRGLVNLARPDGNPFNRDLAEHGRGLVAVGNLTFDIAIFELFIPLLNGVPVVLAGEESSREPEALAALITRHGANALHCTPSRLLSYLEVPAFRTAMEGVDMVLSAGEAFTHPLLDALRRATKARIYNGYGPTEITIGATLGLVDTALTIGTPMAGVHIYILDQHQHLLPAGARGELCVGGAGVARGYLSRPELTAEKFMDWSDGPLHDRIYRTGDFGWCLPDGRLMFSGRDDGQVKLRGLRIELNEIEHRVEQCPGVHQCAVLVKKVDGREHLCCYYSAGVEYDPEAMREYAAAFLPRYMVPDWFFYLDALPSTANGKLDRRALDALPVELERPYLAPETPMEEQLCDIFSQVLDGLRVGAEDSFFDLGGTSLLAARVVLLCKHAGIPVEYNHIFESPTPRKLAAWLEGREKSGAAPEALCTEEEGACIRGALSANRDYVPGGAPLGTVLLTGATGFLGVHVLWELLKHTDSTVCCLVRAKGKLTPEKRLKGSLFYYFEDSFASDFGVRLFAVDGDLNRPDVAVLPEGVRIDTVINCAADVSHFGVDGAIRRTNADGAINLGEFCLNHGVKLIHISTMSVGGFIPRERAEAGVCLSERELWLGQDLSNEYLASKFEAERRLLLARERGLKLKIMRVGNLQGRASDGEFQINRATNGFTSLLRSIVCTGKCPEGLAGAAVNFSPVDAVAEAICLLARSREEYTAFHIFDNHDLPMSALLELLPELGHTVELLPDEAFDTYLHDAAAERAGSDDLAGFLTQVSGGPLVETPCESSFSITALARDGFRWPALSRNYLRSCLEGLETLGFFE